MHQSGSDDQPKQTVSNRATTGMTSVTTKKSISKIVSALSLLHFGFSRAENTSGCDRRRIIALTAKMTSQSPMCNHPCSHVKLPAEQQATPGGE